MNRSQHPLEMAGRGYNGSSAIAPATLEKEWMDDSLHYGRSWHRYRYCYRPSNAIRVLDAGCGTGRSSFWEAMLNPGAQVLGVDRSPTLIEAAKSALKPRLVNGSALEFQVADLDEPLDDSLGLFDFVVCRKVLDEAADPLHLLENLKQRLKPDGLVYISLPSRRGREASKTLRRVVDIFAGPGMTLADRSAIALEIYQGLRPDHPLRLEIAEKFGSEPETFLIDLLAEMRDWSLDEAIALLDQSGLRLLYAVHPGVWRPDRVFSETALEEGLADRFESLDPKDVSRMIDALDPTTVGQDLLLFACDKGYQPKTPTWPSKRSTGFEEFDILIPHPTGIARPLENETRSFSTGRILYQTVSGAVGELDRLSNLMLLASDGRSTVSEINHRLSGQTRASDNEQAKRDCWINLADSGLILLQPPNNPRFQN